MKDRKYFEILICQSVYQAEVGDLSVMDSLIDEIMEMQKHKTRAEACPFCEGRGVFSGDYEGIKCHFCGGTGLK